jgi:plastocyanin
MRKIAVIFAVAATTATTLALSGGAAVAEGVTAPTQKVTVTMTDFKFRLTKSGTVVRTLKAGKATFTMVNKGRSIHDFDIVKVKNGPFIAGGNRGKYTVTLKKGTWRYICTVPRHVALGMSGKLVVK